MAGLSENGLEIKRQGEVLRDLKSDATTIFQDLVPPGDVVDTGDSSTIGRLTGLISSPISDLWEAVQEVYLAFDPNSAWGIAQDNLVAYGGLTRNPATPSTAVVVVWGNESTFIPALTTEVRSRTGQSYQTIIDLELTRTLCSGFRAALTEVTPGTEYGFNIFTGNVQANITTTALSGDTAASIYEKLRLEIEDYASLKCETSNNYIIVETEDVFQYISVEPVNMDLQKIKARVEVNNLEVGNIPELSGDIDSIATPILGWDSVTNPFDAVPGTNRETDEELRIRFRDSKYIRAQNICDALYSVLLELDGVTSVAIYENEGDTYNEEFELPPHSFKVVILGGNPIEIARAIWMNKPFGIGPEGNTIQNITDSQGYVKQMKFDRPEGVPIYISMNLTPVSFDDEVFPGDGADRIRAALIEFFEENFNVGDDIIYSRLYTPINSVPGHQVDELLIGTDPDNLSTDNVVIDYDQIGTLNNVNIIISITS